MFKIKGYSELENQIDALRWLHYIPNLAGFGVVLSWIVFSSTCANHIMHMIHNLLVCTLSPSSMLTHEKSHGLLVECANYATQNHRMHLVFCSSGNALRVFRMRLRLGVRSQMDY
jgi:hypothetical protein